MDVSTLAIKAPGSSPIARMDSALAQVVQWSARRRRMASSCRIKGRWRVGSRTAVWPAMARMHNPRVGECLISKRALLCVLTKSATAASASAVTDRPSRTRFRRARIRCVRLAMLSSRTKPLTVAGVLGSCLVTKVRYLLSPETSGHCARTAKGRPSISLTVMRGLRGCASDCCPCSIVGHAPWPSPATGPPDTGAGSHTEAARSVEGGRRGLHSTPRRWGLTPWPLGGSRRDRGRTPLGRQPRARPSYARRVP